MQEFAPDVLRLLQDRHVAEVPNGIDGTLRIGIERAEQGLQIVLRLV